MKINKLLAALIVVTQSFLFACGSKEQTTQQTQKETEPAADAPVESADVITGSDKVCSITAEGGWKPASGLHQKAQLQASNSYGDMYLVVFSEKKDRYSGVTLEEYSEVTRGHVLKTLASPSISVPVQVTINGNRGLQHEIHGYVRNAKIAYLHTALETPLYFHEIIAWTPDDRFKRNRYALDHAIDSFKEVQTTSSTEKVKGN
jgi:hypothetical protein